MTINDPEKFCASIWDWGFLNQVFLSFNSKIEISDWDGFAGSICLEDCEDDVVTMKQGHVHRHGHHILFEGKSFTKDVAAGPSDPPPILNRASVITHTDLVKIGFSIIYLWGPVNIFPIHRVRIWKEFTEEPASDLFDVTEKGLTSWVANWFVSANRNPLDLSEASWILKSQIRWKRRQ